MENRKETTDGIPIQCLREGMAITANRAFTVSGKLKPEDVVQATLSSLPEEVVDTIGVTALLSEDSVSERRMKLEYLEMQEELIKEEEEKEEEDLARMKESKARKEDAIARALEKRDQLYEISCALAVLASASSVSREREEFLGLVNNEVQLIISLVLISWLILRVTIDEYREPEASRGKEKVVD
ncbi:hypothetical protein ES332_D13G087300v1 [Gossypium tomentosum]|uniref:Uncharacterized protein n=1 Tax=Gossypium tomentosum TaxID=34277 RepID=A0A5D2HUP1_GOSTO|nr:hypothetical protein ES332_D13G087300v1 [Gossypium tomentosum]